MDPISITCAVVSTITSCLSMVKRLRELQEKYQDAPVVLVSICSESNVILASLTQMQMILLQRKSLADMPDELPGVLDQAITGCIVVFSCLELELQRTEADASQTARFAWRSRARFIWNEGKLTELLGALRGQQAAVNLFLQLLQLRALGDIKHMLHQQRDTVQTSARITQSLRTQNPSIRVANSIYARPTESRPFDAVSMVAPSDVEFEFDDLVVNSQVYRRALRAAQEAQAKTPATTRVNPIAVPPKEPEPPQRPTPALPLPTMNRNGDLHVGLPSIHPVQSNGKKENVGSFVGLPPIRRALSSIGLRQTRREVPRRDAELLQQQPSSTNPSIARDVGPPTAQEFPKRENPPNAQGPDVCPRSVSPALTPGLYSESRSDLDVKLKRLDLHQAKLQENHPLVSLGRRKSNPPAPGHHNLGLVKEKAVADVSPPNSSGNRQSPLGSWPSSGMPPPPSLSPGSVASRNVFTNSYDKFGRLTHTAQSEIPTQATPVNDGMARSNSELLIAEMESPDMNEARERERVAAQGVSAATSAAQQTSPSSSLAHDTDRNLGPHPEWERDRNGRGLFWRYKPNGRSPPQWQGRPTYYHFPPDWEWFEDGIHWCIRHRYNSNRHDIFTPMKYREPGCEYRYV